MNSNVNNKDLILKIIESENINPKKKKLKKQKQSRVRAVWVRISKILTCLIPEKYVPGHSNQAKMAWREKVMLCIIIFIISFMLLCYLIWLPAMMCPANYIMNLKEISAKSVYNPFIIIHGKVYDFTELVSKHNRNQAIPHQIYDYAGKDASALFPRPIKVKSINSHRSKFLSNLSDDNMNFKPYYHSWQDLQIASNWNNSFNVCYNWNQVVKASVSDNAWIVVNNEIFDLTQLRNDINNSLKNDNLEKEIFEIMNDVNFKDLISAPWGRDKSEQFQYPNAQLHYSALLKGYFIGVIDFRESFQCKTSNFLMIASTGIVVLVILVKFLASLQLGIKREPEKLKRSVVIMIPCYSEDTESLLRSINSVMSLDYDNRKKIICMIADGNVIGHGNSASTPDLLKRIFGIVNSSQSFIYQSVSSESSDLNRAELYFGHYTTDGHPVPFILIIKVGFLHETLNSGNRGKRDSQLILLKFFSRINYGLPLTPLELELFRGFSTILDINPVDLEFILMVDADTELFSDALNRLLACCTHDSKVIGICGETRIMNEKTSWITMIQIYEYFISHHMCKSFESLFGCVTCLPGCFCMYRLKNLNENKPLLIQRDLIDEYSQTDVCTLHQRNLLSLGEDRYLTTLALKHFPAHRTKFTPDAVCRTVVPETWSVLLSQRRRWINSTIHNLLELMLLPNLCGFCVFSMRFVIFVDLFSTVILPSTVLYMMYLIIKTIEEHFTAKISLLMICSVYGLQMLIFMLKKQWHHVGWMVVYIMAMPIFGFFIPLYSFWHFDDFSWGNTRRLKNYDEEQLAEDVYLGNSNQEPLILKTWEEYLMESNSPILLNSNEFQHEEK